MHDSVQQNTLCLKVKYYIDWYCSVFTWQFAIELSGRGCCQKKASLDNKHKTANIFVFNTWTLSIHKIPLKMNAFNSLFRIISYKSLSVLLYDALQLCCNVTVSYSLVNNFSSGWLTCLETVKAAGRLLAFSFTHIHLQGYVSSTDWLTSGESRGKFSSTCRKGYCSGSWVQGFNTGRQQCKPLSHNVAPLDIFFLFC